MRNYYSLLIALTFFLLSCVHHPTNPEDTARLAPCDTCRNDDPISLYDSSSHQWPYARYSVSDINFSKYFGYCIGTVYTCYWYGSGSASGFGVFIYDPTTPTLKFYAPLADPELSHDGKKIAFSAGFDGIGILDLTTMLWTKITTRFSAPTWSLDDQWIFGYEYNHAYKFRADGTEITFLCSGLHKTRQVDENRIIGLDSDTIRIYNMQNDSIISFAPDMPAKVTYYYGSPFDIGSEHNNKLLFEASSRKGMFDRNSGGVFLYDLETKQVRRILPSQYWGNNYYPRWATNTSFYGTYFCRKDSVAMVYEYDLNGKTIRQVTFKETRLYP